MTFWSNRPCGQHRSTAGDQATNERTRSFWTTNENVSSRMDLHRPWPCSPINIVTL
jgi:hypothetical protein